MLVCAKDRITKCALKVTKHKKGKNKKEQRKNWLKENKQRRALQRREVESLFRKKIPDPT